MDKVNLLLNLFGFDSGIGRKDKGARTYEKAEITFNE
jgi:hypothetical protein